MKNLIILYWNLRLGWQFFWGDVLSHLSGLQLGQYQRGVDFWKLRYRQILNTSPYFRSLYPDGDYPELSHVISDKQGFTLVLHDSTEVYCSPSGKIISIDRPDHLSYTSNKS